MQVLFYHSLPHEAYFSVDRVFVEVRRALPDNIDARVVVSRFLSRGFFRRVYIAFEAACRQGDVNHITGDVHFLALLLRKRKTLLTIHDLVSLHRLKGWRKAVFLFLWYWLPIRRVAMVSVVSQSTRKELLRHIKVDPRKVRIVHDPVSPDFQPIPREFNATKPVILQIGTRSNKNVARVAHAIQGIPCHLRVIGKLEEEQLAVLSQCAVDHSAVSDISDAQVVDEYRRCDMVVFASTYEGFGLPIVEAQATGRPVVTSNVCSMPEVAGDAACLVDPFDTASIRAGILRVIGDSEYRERLIRSGLQNVERFQPEAIARQYVDLYQELASGVTKGRPCEERPPCS